MKLASIEKIEKVYPHPNADRLELAKVLGYQCVVPKDIYSDGDTVVFIQPDTVLPKNQEWAEEYLKYSPKRVKAVKLRQEWSEGIIVPMIKFVGILPIISVNNVIEVKEAWANKVGDDISDIIGVTKYEPPIPANESAIGRLPYQMSKTDEERFENLGDKIPYGKMCDVTLKIDGQSATYGYNLEEDKFFITGRRFEVSSEDENRYSVHAYKVKDKLIEYCKKHNVSLALRGESYGNGIQSGSKNPHSSLEHNLAIFSVWNIDERRYENKGSKHYFKDVCEELDIDYVPILEENVEITEELLNKYSKELKKLPNGNYFEGVVIQHPEGSFKVINKFYDSEK